MATLTSQQWLGIAQAVVHRARGRIQDRDVVVLASSLTFFAGIALAPLVLVAVALAGVLTSPAQMVDLGSGLARALPDALGAPVLVDTVIRSGLGMDTTDVLLALVPISVYGEGLRQVLRRLQRPGPGGGRDSGTGWRGRVAVLPLVLIAPILLLGLVVAAGAVADLQDSGGTVAPAGAAVLGYYAVLVVLLFPIAWTFRVVAAGRMGWTAVAVGSFLTAASLAGFLQGLVLFPALPLPLGEPFGGLTAVGAVVAGAFWVFLLHLVLLVGWVLTLAVEQAKISDGGGITVTRA